MEKRTHLFLDLPPRPNGDSEYINLNSVESILIPGDSEAACIVTLNSGRTLTIHDEWDGLLELMNEIGYSVEKR